MITQMLPKKLEGNNLYKGSFTFKCMTIAPTSKTASPVGAMKAEKGHQIPTNIKNPNDSLRKRIKSLNQSGRL